MILIGVTSYRVHESEDLLRCTEKCLNSLVSQKCDYPYIVMLIDDSSQLEAIPESVILKKVNFNNLSKSWNTICSIAFYELNCSHVLIVANDVVLLKNSLQKLLDFATQYKEKPCIISGYETNGEPGVPFAHFLMSRRVYESVGEFDEHFWGSGLEDWDYIERLKQKNIPIISCSDFIVEHGRSMTRKLYWHSDEWKKKDMPAIEYYRKKWGEGKHELP